MPIKKGQIINPNGRPRGSANKTTAEIRTAFQRLVSNNLDQLQDDLDNLDPEKRIAYVIKFAEFILPKLQSLSIDSQLELEYKHLESLLSKADDRTIDAITAKILTIKQQHNETDS